MNETDAMFEEIQNEGMADIGTAVSFDMDGRKCAGVINNPQVVTEMLTGGYQGRAQMVILATRGQFAAQPAQKGIVVITAPDIFTQGQWNRTQVEPYGAAHYAITVMHQLTSQ